MGKSGRLPITNAPKKAGPERKTAPKSRNRVDAKAKNFERPNGAKTGEFQKGPQSFSENGRGCRAAGEQNKL